MLHLPLLLLLLQSPVAEGPAGEPQERPAPPWSNAVDVDLIDDERESLAGVTTVAVSVILSETVAGTLATESVTSAVTQQLETAGLKVSAARAIDEPLLVVTVRAIEEGAAGVATRTLVYRVYADLLQLVRLADRESGIARLMMASTWHAGSFGTIETGALEDLRSRIRDVISAFTADHAVANPKPATPPESPAPRS